MSFEGADGTFGYVAPMDVGGYQLVCISPDVGDVSAVFLSGFIVEDLVVDDVTTSLEAGHNVSVVRYAVAVFSCLEGLDEDGVCIAVVGHHQVLVATAIQTPSSSSPSRHEKTATTYMTKLAS